MRVLQTLFVRVALKLFSYLFSLYPRLKNGLNTFLFALSFVLWGMFVRQLSERDFEY